MSLNTKIQWADATWNPWIGCTKVSPGCQHCYAERIVNRFGVGRGGGPQGTRRIAAESTWRLPLLWNKRAAKSGQRLRVFCGSMMDVFEERDELIAPRRRLFELIGITEHLDWLLLTKRPEMAVKNWPIWLGYAHGARLTAGLPLSEKINCLPSNVWLGTSVEDQQRANKRIPALLDAPAAVRFLSVEPLLGPIDISGWLKLINWVILGGESGPRARPCQLNWMRSLVQQCREVAVPVFVKQLGSKPVEIIEAWQSLCGPFCSELLQVEPLIFSDSKGGDMAEWPEDLRIRELRERL